MEFTYFGMLRSPVSWAKIGRELSLAFIKSGDTVHAFERRGFSYNKDFKLSPELEKAIVTEFRGNKTLSFEHPSNYKYITTKQKYGMLVYETTAAPKLWAEKANESLDLLFLPNEFNKKIFIEAGVRPELIRIVPHGFNPEVFKGLKAEGGRRKESLSLRPPPSALHPKNRFQFLCVAMPQRRKGIDVLLSAFEKAFDGNDDVELIIKFPYAPGRSKYDLSNQDLGIGNPPPLKLRRSSRVSGIADKTEGVLNFKSQISNVKFIIGEYTEEQMADLYRSADCFVLPSRAEGFGLVYLEALACGVPVIATGWGGHMEFLNEGNSLLLKYKEVPAAGIQYDNDASGGLMAEPSVDDLAEKLKYMVASYDKEAAKVNNLDLSRFYWGNIAEQMRGEIQG